MFNEDGPTPAADEQPVTEPAAQEDPTLNRFKSCRWHATQEGAEAYCSHRDVLPYAGMNGFVPEAWCHDCTFYKVRRTVKKKPDQQFDYGY